MPFWYLHDSDCLFKICNQDVCTILTLKWDHSCNHSNGYTLIDWDISLWLTSSKFNSLSWSHLSAHLLCYWLFNSYHLNDKKSPYYILLADPLCNQRNFAVQLLFEAKIVSSCRCNWCASTGGSTPIHRRRCILRGCSQMTLSFLGKLLHS